LAATSHTKKYQLVKLTYYMNIWKDYKGQTWSNCGWAVLGAAGESTGGKRLASVGKQLASGG